MALILSNNKHSFAETAPQSLSLAPDVLDTVQWGLQLPQAQLLLHMPVLWLHKPSPLCLPSCSLPLHSLEVPLNTNVHVYSLFIGHLEGSTQTAM